MQLSVDMPGCSVNLLFQGREAARDFFRETLQQQAFLLSLAEAPDPFASFTVTAMDPGGLNFSFRACVVHVFAQEAACGVAFQLTDWDSGLQAQLDRQLATPESTQAPGETMEGENFGVAPIYRIKQMELPQKMLLALKADRTERELLCRDTAPMVLLNLLSNPRLEADNVLAIVKSIYATGEIFQRVASDRRWLASAEIRTAVVRNPRTPTPVAVKLLETLPLGELRDLAKLGSAREPLRLAAFKLYTKFNSRG